MFFLSLCVPTILEGSVSASELDSALVPLATERVSDFHSVSGLALDLALESDSLAEPDSELAPEFGSASASDFQPEPHSALSLEQLRQYPLLPAFVEFVSLAQLATE